MSNNIDFKAMWTREETPAPDISEIFAKANQLSRKTRNKIWRGNILLTLTGLFMVFVWWYYQPQTITTKIGLILIMVAITVFVGATSKMFPLLAKTNVETDSQQFLAQMIRIKQKQEFLGSTMLTGYFILLSAGIFLYMIEYAGRGSLTFQLTAYGLTAAWIAYNWFYIRPRTIKKQQTAIKDIIDKLQALNNQLLS